MADTGWIAVAGVLVGSILTGAIALIQTRLQQRFDAFKVQEDRRWNEHVSEQARYHTEMAQRREELVQVYTRYQLAADRLENAIRELAGAGADDIARGDDQLASGVPSLRHASRESFEAAQNEYDVACQLVNLLAPLTTARATRQQRQLFNRFATQALAFTYDHEASHDAIVGAADPVLEAMRTDLNHRGERGSSSAR